MLPGVGLLASPPGARDLVPLLRAEGFRVEALWARAANEARALAHELRVPMGTNHADELLLWPQVHLLYICLPPPLTRQVAVKALGIGKNVVSGPPVSALDARRMVQQALYYPGLLSLLAFPLRLLPACTQARSLVQEGYLGELQVCEARVHVGSLLSPMYDWSCERLMGGGALRVVGTHLVDLLAFLTGKRARRAFGLTRTYSGISDQGASSSAVGSTSQVSGIRATTADDFCCFLLVLEDGAVATVTLNCCMPGRADLELCLVGSHARLVLRGTDLYGCRYRDREDETTAHQDIKDQPDGLVKKDEERRERDDGTSMTAPVVMASKRGGETVTMRKGISERLGGSKVTMRAKTGVEPEKVNRKISGTSKCTNPSQNACSGSEPNDRCTSVCQTNVPKQETLLLADRVVGPTSTEATAEPWKGLARPGLAGTLRLLRALRRAFEGRRERQAWDPGPLGPAADFEDGLYALRVAEAIEEAAEAGEWRDVSQGEAVEPERPPGSRNSAMYFH
uniref:glucose-fructose oxidoreductase domain-containing protein 1-like n=1 Tax=Myxine glutinosa TaxID=7769 RepID=UPI00358E7B92